MRLYLVALLISTAHALPDGAPTSACNTLKPVHEGALPQANLAPYSVFVKQQGDVVQVTIGSNLGVPFQGFMVQGRTPEGRVIGSFQLPGGSQAHTIDCKGAGDTATHNSPEKKDLVNLIWVPPTGYQGSVVFASTILQSFETFWVGLESDVVEVRRRSVRQDSFYSNCGVTKYCYGAPIDCVDAQNCKVAVAVTSVGEAFDFELRANGNPAWVGVGLSDDARMGDDSVVECVKDKTTGKVEAFLSWTTINPYGAPRLEKPQEGIRLLNASVDEDVLYCKVRRDTVTNIKGTVFDLRANSFHVLVAAGAELKDNSVGFHDLSYLASPDPQVLSPNSQSLFVNRPDISTTTTPAYFEPPAARPAAAEFDAFYEGCAVTKMCFGAPEDCVRTRACRAAVAVTVAGDRYDFEMKATANAAWVGVGLSDDAKMGDDSVIECVKTDRGVRSYMSLTGIKPYRAVRLQNPQLGIELLNSSVIDDTIYCKVRRSPVTLVGGTTYDLTNNKYHVLVAAGDSATPNSVGFHNVQLPSKEKLFLSDTAEVAAPSKLLVHLHGAFMLAAWIGTASVGILLARYYRQTWVGTTMMGKDLWFAWHRFFMVLTWLFTIAAFVIIFVELRKWSEENNPHAILGTVTTILCFFQPIGAYFRPHPGTSKRSIFNWAHWLAGNAAHIIAIVTLFFAVRLTKAELPEEVDYILVAYVVVSVVAHLLLSILYGISEKSGDSRVSSFPMKDLGGSGRNSVYNDRNMDARFSTARKFILGVYIVIILVLVIGLILITVFTPAKDLFR
ncbi:unnamed protein product [Phyllotreta striolata]|uniref:Ferric-chelate reductase 1 n=1 Tax=Phyllotreta striolata TaxID=444603 RepID=A0A9N9U052_PHYSR|nr:unnamed protein product [Phyllotreta striolata]